VIVVRKIFLFLFSVVFVAGCGGSSSTPPAKTSNNSKSSAKKYAYRDQDGNPADQDSIEDLIYSELSKRQQALLKRYTLPTGTHSLGGMKFDIPVTMNDRVREWIDYFVNGAGRKHFERYLSRSTRVVPIQLRILKENRMPKDLIFLSMIESGFNTHAYSSAAAVGLWQFIRSTGRLYGLDNDYWVDERRHPEKATQAAAHHLRDLYEEFGDWYLAFAAYNAGAGKVRRAIEMTGSRDFWTLASSSYLRQETKDYVPKILAAAIIGKSPEKYGFSDVEYQDPIPTELVTIPASTDLDVIAECAGVDADLIRLINPELLRNVTPPTHYALSIPRGTKANFERRYAHLDENQRLRNVRYVAQKGDTLRSIAEDHGVTLSSLMNANPALDGRRNVSAGTKVIVPRAYDSPPPVPVDKVYASTSTGKGKRLVDLIAEKDENETPKSKKEKKVSKKSDDNDGEMKVVWKDSEKKDAPAEKVAPAELRKDSEDTAPKPIADNDAKPSAGSTDGDGAGAQPANNVDDRIGKALAQVDAENPEGETDGGGVRVKPSGEDTDAESPKTTAKTRRNDLPPPVKVGYTVKRGETLASVANKYGVTVQDVKDWNHIKGNRGLLANQKLVLYTDATPKGSDKSTKVAAKENLTTKGKVAGAKAKVIAYKVRKGDTIHKIAKMYEVTASEILAFNGLSRKAPLKPGLVLRIPAKTVSRG
jgi:membrane-bound lytic murein transglycosylase D